MGVIRIHIPIEHKKNQYFDLNSAMNSNPEMQISKNINLSILGLKFSRHELFIGFIINCDTKTL